MHGCHKCNKTTAILILLIGIGFLLRDLGSWTFWNVQWWTALFLVLGITWLAKSCCGDCCKMDDKMKKGK